MYYQNGNYMQDLNYYNQTPNFGYNPYMANQNMNMGQMPMQQQNLNSMYPAVYRIILPVANQVLGNNTGYLTEENLNNMVDQVYNIVEKDINLENNSNCTSQTSAGENSNYERNSVRPSATTNDSVTTRVPNRQNSLLKDLIRIILLNEIISRRHRNQAMMMQNNMPMNQQMFM